MPEAVESEKVHFFQGLIGGQFFKGHAVGSDEDSGAVIAVVAVHEDLFLGAIAENG